MRNRLAALAAAALLSAFAVTPVLAHGNPEISVDRVAAAPGESLHVTGEEFEEDLELHLELIGVGGTTELADVTTDDSGAFSVTATIPADVRPGTYRIVAQGPDESASVDFEVLAGPAAAPPLSETATAVEGETSDTVTAALAFAIGGVAMLGAVLAWRR